MNRDDGSMKARVALAAADPADPAGADEPQSRVVAGILGVLAILPTLMLSVLMPTMVRATVGVAMNPVQLAATLLALVLLPAGIALLFWRRRGAFTVFVIAALFGLATIGSPFGRIVLGGVMVSVIGAVIAWLRGREPASR